MQLLNQDQRLVELFALFVSQVKGSGAIGLTDINRISETVLVPLFAEVYGYRKLRNLNVTDTRNFPAVDLADEEARIAFQVTATTDSEKIKDTLRKFAEHRLYDRYSRLVVYILTDKQRSYSGKGFTNIIQGRFEFEKDRDIRDYTDLLQTITTFSVAKKEKIIRILEASLMNRGALQFEDFVAESTAETVELNLVEVWFPQHLFVADALLADSGEGDWGTRRTAGRSRRSSARDRVRTELGRLGYKFSTEWECSENKIISFHDLSDREVALSRIIDQGTVTKLSCREYFEFSVDQENIFRSLLRRCLQQFLYHKRVFWQEAQRMFIFGEIDGQAIRRESWQGEKRAEREVYKRTMKSNKPDEILRCKHLAFEVQFRRISERWYMMITPDWFFSYDGYKKSGFDEDRVKWLKRHENNSHITNHVRFFASFLRQPEQLGLFQDQLPLKHRSFLSFSSLVSFDHSPRLDDKRWLPPTYDDDSDHELDDSAMTSDNEMES